jgi:hypothetical protein
LSIDDARDIVADFVEHYNTRRLHSAIGYIAPKDKLEGRTNKIFSARDKKLETARRLRKERRCNHNFQRTELKKPELLVVNQ